MNKVFALFAVFLLSGCASCGSAPTGQQQVVMVQSYIATQPLFYAVPTTFIFEYHSRRR